MRDYLDGIRLSISTRLAIWYGLGFLILLSLFVTFLYAGIHLGLHGEFEGQLQSDENLLAETVWFRDGLPGLDENRAQAVAPVLTRGVAGTYVRLFGWNGNLTFQSQNFEDRPDLSVVIPQSGQGVTIAREWGGDPARSRYLALRGGGQEVVGWLETTRLESKLHNELHRIRWLLGLGVLLGVVIAILGGYWMARRALLPVALITEAARRIPAEIPGQRLPVDFGVEDELTDLANTLNDLLSRLDASFERERRFRADAAHEMFTPLSALQAELDVAARRPREAAYYQESMEAMRSHVSRLSRVVDELLQLSRAEESVGCTSPVEDARDLVHSVGARFQGQATQHEVQLQIDSGPDPLPVSMGAGDLRTVLENLVDNAIKYTPPNGAVRLRSFVEAGHVVMIVDDTGTGFLSEDAENLFGRFYRADSAQVQSVRGSGLGLSIVRAIVDSHGGSIRASSEGPSKGSCFELRLPLAGDSTLQPQPIKITH
ncbi:MAG: signal transduction histidine kinase [Rhodothermales bacterium]|jgi:signal transduction histidine kinase